MATGIVTVPTWNKSQVCECIVVESVLDEAILNFEQDAAGADRVKGASR